jgi:hypothetical protein
MSESAYFFFPVTFHLKMRVADFLVSFLSWVFNKTLSLTASCIERKCPLPFPFQA